MGGKRSDAQKAAIVVRRQQVIKLRVSGASLRKIAEALNVSYQQVKRDFDGAMKELNEDNFIAAGHAQVIINGRLETIIDSLWDRAIKGDLKALDRVLRATDMQARLHGLYQPAAGDGSPPTGDGGAEIVTARHTKIIIERREERPKLLSDVLDELYPYDAEAEPES